MNKNDSEGISITSLSKTIDQSNDAINFIEVYELPQPRLRAWKQFEEYTKRTEEMERSSGFRSVLKSRYYGNPSLNYRYRKGFYSLFKTLQQNLQHYILRK